jgi:DNA polymerase I-like protein with 3'-5' exonuclease and polymerase domains
MGGDGVNVLTFDVLLSLIGYKWLDEEQVFYDCYYHETEPPTHSAAEDFQTSLDYADVVVGQNIKFDLAWIRDCGFRYTGEIYDTMVAEYVLSKARRWPLGLAALAKKYNTVQKEKDLVEPFMADGKTFFEIPWEIIKEYGTSDVVATEQIALKQLEAFGTTFEELYNAADFTSDIKTVA